MATGFYAGSFDPFTNGHLHIVELASEMFDRVIIGIGINPTKQRRFNKILMKDAIENMLVSRNIKNAEVLIYDGFTAQCANDNNATFLIRGLRNGIDYDYEEQIAIYNREHFGIETLYFRAGDFGNISSSMVYELLQKNEDISAYVPKSILRAIQKD